MPIFPNRMHDWLSQRCRQLRIQSEVLDQLRRESEASVRANRHRADFLASMSHEIRTPLNAIVGFSEVLLDRTTIEIPEAQRQIYLEHIHGSALHLLRLVNDVLDMAKVEAGRLDLQVERICVRELLDSCVAVIGGVASQRRLKFIVNAQPPECVIHADHGRLKQILYNLLSNAVKFTPDGGQISLDARTGDGQVEISVTDTGRGIDPADQELIFEPFEQVGPRTAREHGTGLGLALVRRLVVAQGGTISVESALGKGSTFRLRLPVTADVAARELVS